MFQKVVTFSILGLCYLCLAIIVFAPTLYAAWFYYLSREDSRRKAKLLRATLTTFIVNAVFAYLLGTLAYNYLVPPMLAKNDATAVETVRSAIESQERHFVSRGRYYAVGPVKGPYQDEFGLSVPQGVILQVTPVWDKEADKETFEAHAVNIWGSKVLWRRSDGRIAHLSNNSDEASRLKAKLLRSVE
ncbi:MAG: hypothetical protein LDL33_04025 [Desulfomonile sp.]|nr:hypothetical protein [Desulfomonile sp.]